MTSSISREGFIQTQNNQEVIVIDDEDIKEVIVIEDDDIPLTVSHKLSDLNELVQQNKSFPLSWISSKWSNLDIQNLIAHCAKFKLTSSDILTLTGRFRKYVENRNFALSLLEKNCQLFKYLAPPLRLDTYIVNQVVAKDPSLFRCTLKLSKNKARSPFKQGVLSNLIETNKNVFRYFTDAEKSNLILASKAINRKFTLFKEIPLSKKKDLIFIDQLFSRIKAFALKPIITFGNLTPELKEIAKRYL